MASAPDPEAEALLRLYVIENGDVGAAALRLARDMVDALDETKALADALRRTERLVSSGFIRLTERRP